jgi:type I restriction enzyme S subunit
MKRWLIGDSEIRISRAGLEKSPARMIPTGSVLVVVRSGVLKHTLPVALTTAPVTVNQDLKALMPAEGVHGPYLARFIKAMEPRVLSWVRATTADNFPVESLLDLPVSLPPLEEQRRIAAILDRADQLLELRSRSLKLTGSLRTAIFDDMFGSASLTPLALNEVCVRITDGTHQSPKWAADGIPFLFVSNITSGELTFDTAKYISAETWAALTARCPIEPGDVLYSTVGSYGVPAVVRTERRFAFQRHIAHLKPRRDVMHPEVLAAQLASPALRRQADAAARGVAQKTVNLKDIKSFHVVVPPMVDQLDFVRRLEHAERMSSGMRASLDHMRLAAAALRAAAFSGSC